MASSCPLRAKDGKRLGITKRNRKASCEVTAPTTAHQQGITSKRHQGLVGSPQHVTETPRSVPWRTPDPLFQAAQPGVARTSKL